MADISRLVLEIDSSGVVKATGNLDAFGRKAEEAAEQSGRMEKSASGLDRAVSALSPSALSAVAGITALIGTVKSLRGALGGALDSYSRFESMEKALGTFFQDAGRGKQVFEDLRRLSNETTFGVDELASSFTQLANVGVEVDSINDRLVMLGNISGGDKSKFSELVSIYAKIQSTGKAGAMQLQQIAQRGIPIYDVLRKIGVQGTATGADITRAFEEMTREGGQFHDAMNAINDTIEGKRGFITDYLTELGVNFVELTGLADIYKAVLDVLKEAIGAVSDKLLEWNKNPVIKALISGAFVGMVSAVGMAILTNIIPHLLKVIAHLTTINILSGPKGWATLAVAGIAVATTAIVSYRKSVGDAADETERLAAEAAKVRAATSPNGDVYGTGVIPSSYSNSDRLARAKSELDSYKKKQEELNGIVKETKKRMDALRKEYGGNIYGMLPDSVENEIASMNKELSAAEAGLERVNALIDGEERLVRRLEATAGRYDAVREMGEAFGELYEKLFPEEKEKHELRKQLEDVISYRDELKRLAGQVDNSGQIIKFDDRTKEEIDRTIKYLDNKIKGVTAWRDFFEQVTGVEALTTGKQAGEDYIARINASYDKQLEIAKALGKTTENISVDFARKIQDDITRLMENSKVDEVFTANDASIKAMLSGIDMMKQRYLDSGHSLEEWTAALNGSRKALDDATLSIESVFEELRASGSTAGQVMGYFGSSLMSASSDLSNFAQGFAQGGIIGGVISAIAGAVMNVAGSMDKFDKVMNPITTAFAKLSPLLEIIIDDLSWATDVFTAILSIVGMFLKILSPIIKVISMFTRVLGAGVRWLGVLADMVTDVVDSLDEVQQLLGWLADAFSWLTDMEESGNELAEQQRAEAERLRVLNEQYSRLSDAIDEQQQYYLRQRTQLRASTLYDSLSGRSVNDMIITPQGVFNTHPEDTIMAMKHPERLGSGQSVSVVINNNASDAVSVSASAQEGDMQRLMITISRKIAGDVASGANGWDSAMASRQARLAGRRLS